jgi:hypothetical protein
MGSLQREEIIMFFVATGEKAKALDGERSKLDATISVAAYATRILPDALIAILIVSD